MNDRDIIQLYFARNESAVEETSKKYKKYCTQIARNILSNVEDSEECVNDTFLGAWEAIPPKSPEKLSSFLGRITRNIALNKYDYYKAKKRNKEFETILDELNDCVSSSDNVESQYEGEQMAESISEFLQSIKEDHRNIFLRRYWYSDSMTDIASRFAISESKTKSILFRIRKKLQIYLKKEGYVL
ncbi:RNA polymerase sigma factor [Paenibacillus macquariensis]|uniref:RNA polymerase sigma-70 factor, ECF subfamily n=1 Tax=Paenibacillus macquariensis TaxID=948756 RepID=A0ABY1K5K8_9BACL|nr:RNA polymerase sigma factor [Paenibacillus macquariensis]MEC0090464.1 RNA polymerase sigma factor [Paenibacillus macquariensis]OAB35187.1 RNA polymerase subunit sigma-70 [Paenibacillus macquariensis subsp. macquariensis]SIR29576.1 RNA polymerase sigma-70 factor, ECF subfamily [Paenibacillus macquariensis]